MKKWDKNLWLFTLTEFEELPDGIELISINGHKVVKGRDHICLDVRFNHIAYGVKNPIEHELKELFILFKLREKNEAFSHNNCSILECYL